MNQRSLPSLSPALAAAALLTLAAAPARAQDDKSQRYAEVYAQRLELQDSLRTRLEHTLSAIAHPYTVTALVRVQMRTQVTEVTDRSTREGVDLKLGSSEEVKLPGLPTLRGPSSGVASPNVTLKLPGESRVQTRNQIDGVVEQLSVKLWVERGVPADQLELIRQTATEIAALDTARGDSLELLEMPSRMQKTVVQESERSLIAVGVFSATLLLCALILAWSLRGRRGQGAASSVTANISAHEDGLAGNGNGNGKGNGIGALALADGAVAVLPGGPRNGRGRRFEFLAGAAAADLLDVLHEVKPRTAAAILDQVAVAPELVASLFKQLDAAQRLSLVEHLARAAVLDVSEVEQLEAEARSVYDEVLRRVALGGALRAADLLAAASQDELRQTLEGLGARDPELVEAIRKGMLLFEDIPRLGDDELRLVVGSLDPSVTAVALQGAAPALREALYKPLSKRLRGILEAEQEGTPPQPAEAVEAARRRVEAAMRAARAGRAHGAGAQAVAP